MLRYAIATTLLLSTSVAAQEAPSTETVLAERADDRWEIGIGVVARDSPYAGEGTRIRPFPMIRFEGQRFFWRGLAGGVHLFKSESFGIDALVSGRFDGFDIDDLGRAELARNGVDARLLSDRDDALDLGLAVRWEGRAGELTVRALADVTDTSGGYELGADYAYPLQLGQTTLVPGVGVRWLSDDLANYYHGTLDEEIRRGVVAYRADAAVVPQVSLGFQRPLSRNWKLSGGLQYQFLPSEITDSPLMERDVSGTASLRLGISRGF